MLFESGDTAFKLSDAAFEVEGGECEGKDGNNLLLRKKATTLFHSFNGTDPCQRENLPNCFWTII
jgi:hypothetical protein